MALAQAFVAAAVPVPDGDDYGDDDGTGLMQPMQDLGMAEDPGLARQMAVAEVEPAPMPADGALASGPPPVPVPPSHHLITGDSDSEGTSATEVMELETLDGLFRRANRGGRKLDSVLTQRARVERILFSSRGLSRNRGCQAKGYVADPGHQIDLLFTSI